MKDLKGIILEKLHINKDTGKDIVDIYIEGETNFTDDEISKIKEYASSLFKVSPKTISNKYFTHREKDFLILHFTNDKYHDMILIFKYSKRNTYTFNIITKSENIIDDHAEYSLDKLFDNINNSLTEINFFKHIK